MKNKPKNFLTDIFRGIRENIFWRNVVLAVCSLVIFVFLAQILLNLGTRHGQVLEVPDFSGLTFTEARSVAEKADLRLEINDSLYLPAGTGGIVLEQNPAPGAHVKSGRRVFITVNSFRPKTARIPYVTGYSLRQAKNNLEVAGFAIERLIYREDIATNNVLEQRYKGQTVLPQSDIEAPAGSGITLVVGVSGNPAVQVPKVVGFPVQEAKSRLWEQGLNIGKIEQEAGITEVNINEARVYRQRPNAGSRQQLGAKVNLYLTLDETKVAAGQKDADRAARLEAEKAAREAADSAAVE